MTQPAWRIGTAPINWNNADIPDWRPETPYPAILDEIVAAGYEGTELGDNFPRDVARLRADLRARGLTLTSTYVDGNFTDPTLLDGEVERVLCTARFLAEMGCRLLVVAALGDGSRRTLAGHTAHDGSDSLRPAQWEMLAGAMNRLGAEARKLGLQAVYHNEGGTLVETRAELDELMARTDPALVGLCLDSGHLRYGGDDPVPAVHAHAGRIAYVHLKDVDPTALEEVKRERLDFIGALHRGVFCELGEGCADAAGVLEALRAIGYAGWIVVEQDTSTRHPTESARASREFVRRVIGEAR